MKRWMAIAALTVALLGVGSRLIHTPFHVEAVFAEGDGSDSSSDGGGGDGASGEGGSSGGGAGGGDLILITDQ